MVDLVPITSTSSRPIAGTADEVELTSSGTPGTRSDEVLISSRDAVPAPRIAAAKRLAEKAHAAGWTVRITYARARVPAVPYADPKRAGEVKRPAHDRHTVAVRLARGPARAYAVWACEGVGRWDFDHAVLLDGQVPTYLGLRALIKRITS